MQERASHLRPSCTAQTVVKVRGTAAPHPAQPQRPPTLGALGLTRVSTLRALASHRASCCGWEWFRGQGLAGVLAYPEHRRTPSSLQPRPRRATPAASCEGLLALSPRCSQPVAHGLGWQSRAWQTLQARTCFHLRCSQAVLPLPASTPPVNGDKPSVCCWEGTCGVGAHAPPTTLGDDQGFTESH